MQEASYESSSLGNGLLYIFGGIDEEMARECLERVMFWANLPEGCQPRQIRVLINSCGGECSSAISIINSIKLIGQNIPVITHVIGDCMSAAVAIASVGDWRIAHAMSVYMIHGPYLSHSVEVTKGRAESTQISLELEEKRMLDIFYREIAKKRESVGSDGSIRKRGKRLTSALKGKFEAYMKKDTYLAADEVMELGLIDEIIKD